MQLISGIACRFPEALTLKFMAENEVCYATKTIAIRQTLF